MKKAMKRTNIYLSTIQLDKLNKQAEKTGLSVSELIRRAIDGCDKTNNSNSP